MSDFDAPRIQQTLSAPLAEATWSDMAQSLERVGHTLERVYAELILHYSKVPAFTPSPIFLQSQPSPQDNELLS